jgi:transglutaminase-like putative cysteine protease
MKKRSIFLFAMRFVFYFSILILMLIHPGIQVSFDKMGVVQWFVIIPLMSLIAFLPEGKPFFNNFKLSPRSRYAVACVLLVYFALFAGGLGINAVAPFAAGIISFVLTILLFRYPRWGKPAVLEPFFLAWIALKLLALSRSGEDIAGQSMALTQFVFVWTAVVFLFHGIVVYFCLYPESTGGARKEATALFFMAGALLVVVLAVLPTDFVRNSVVENFLQEVMPQKVGESEKGMPRDDGNRSKRRDGRRNIPRGEGKGGELRGISEHEWQNKGKGSSRGRGRGSGGESDDNRQYLVMIVASQTEPVYMGDVFRGKLDPVEGFLVTPEEQFNRLAGQRFFTTWVNNERVLDTAGRQRLEIFSLSSEAQRYLPWRPVSFDPTIISENSGPLRYIHQVISDMHVEDPLDLLYVPARPYTSQEKSYLAPYMDFPLYESDRRLFQDYLDDAFKMWQEYREEIVRELSQKPADKQETIPDGEWYYFPQEDSQPSADPDTVNEQFKEPVNEYLERILAIMMSFSGYQYNLSFSEEYTIEDIKEFLFNSGDGDCTEFSNTLALLGRLAGIPSRVVTGYFVSEDTQMEPHLRGLAALRAQIPFLQEFDFNDLFMVTNMHGHSWTQFYIPEYGWLDFESTMFAIPPPTSVNDWDVVIPLIDENRTLSQLRKFPWRSVLRAAAFFAGFALVFAYALRYGREIALSMGTRRGGRQGARSLYLLLLARLAADGNPIKPASKTATEYSELFSRKDAETQRGEKDLRAENNVEHLKAFASLYSEIRWKEFDDKEQMQQRFDLLTQEYQAILDSTRKRGIHHWLKRLISLRGLAYL